MSTGEAREPSKDRKETRMGEAKMAAMATGTLTPLEAARLQERLEAGGALSREEALRLCKTADHQAERLEEYRHGMRVLLTFVEEHGLKGPAELRMLERDVRVMP